MPNLPTRRPLAWLLLVVALLAGWRLWPTRDAVAVPGVGMPTPTSPLPARSPPLAGAHSDAAVAVPDPLPAEARRTIALVQRGGPFPYRQDGGVFGNREGHLPRQPRGW